MTAARDILLERRKPDVMVLWPGNPVRLSIDLDRTYISLYLTETETENLLLEVLRVSNPAFIIHAMAQIADEKAKKEVTP